MSASIHITINPIQETVEARPGETLRDILLRNGINIEGPCNGQGTCGQCGVWVESPADVPYTAHKNISAEQAKAGLRLACQVSPRTDMTIRLPEDFSRDAQRIKETQQILEGERISWGRVASAVKIFENKGQWFLRYDGLAEDIKIPGWRGNMAPKGLAVDLGTTSMVVSLISLGTGEELSTASMLNPQIRYGHDVISRITHGSTPQGLEALFQAVSQGLNRLIREACQDSGTNPKEILDVVIGGNTTMLQLAAAINPAPLGKIPFRVDIKGGTSYPAERFGLAVNPVARTYIPPIIHAFIGTDVTAGLLMSGEFFKADTRVLYLDVGTNGEIAINNQGQRFAASTAAGPAFEGSSLSSGMRAGLGALSGASTDGYQLELTTIGHVPVKGVCGSGIVDLVACLLDLGVVDRTGRMKTNKEELQVGPEVLDRLERIDGQPVIRLGRSTVFTQQDVRAIQLCKGAIRATVNILLEKAGLQATELERIIIAGGFGFHLNARNLERIGLIPHGTSNKVEFAGNASRSGCVWLLNDIVYRRFLESHVADIGHVSIAGYPGFMDLFVECMEFSFPEI
ncbi:MAG TPA: ASKHA domain-containing protein [Desulfosalsimonadaceae bacterium]|nr:ASKHA domain-containing protein [Desulfosalsimonadaceae bacterium]